MCTPHSRIGNNATDDFKKLIHPFKDQQLPLPIVILLLVLAGSFWEKTCHQRSILSAARTLLKDTLFELYSPSTSAISRIDSSEMSIKSSKDTPISSIAIIYCLFAPAANLDSLKRFFTDLCFTLAIFLSG